MSDKGDGYKDLLYVDPILKIHRFADIDNYNYDVFFWDKINLNSGIACSGAWMWVQYKTPILVITMVIKKLKKLLKDNPKYAPTIMRLTALKESL